MVSVLVAKDHGEMAPGRGAVAAGDYPIGETALTAWIGRSGAQALKSIDFARITRTLASARALPSRVPGHGRLPPAHM